MGTCMTPGAAKRHSRNGITNCAFFVLTPKKNVDIKVVPGPLRNQMDANITDEIVATIEHILLHSDESNLIKYQKYQSLLIGLLVFMILFGGLAIWSPSLWPEQKPIIAPVMMCTLVGVVCVILTAMVWMGRIMTRAAKSWRNNVVQRIYTQMHEWSVQWPQFQMSYSEDVWRHKGSVSNILAILEITAPLVPDCNTPVFMTGLPCELHKPQTLENEITLMTPRKDTQNTNVQPSIVSMIEK